MKIFMVEPVGDYGGMGHYDRSLCSNLAAIGVDITWLTTDVSDLTPKNVKTISIFRGIYKKDEPIFRVLRFFRGWVSLFFRLLIQRPNRAHFHCFRFNIHEAAMVLAAVLTRTKIVATIHDVEAFVGNSSGIVQGWMLRAFDKIVVHNLSSKRSLLNINPAADIKTHVIPHGHYIDFISRHGGASDSNSNESEVLGQNQLFEVLLFGQLKAVKGLDVLIDALGSVANDPKSKRIRVKVCGRPWHLDVDELKTRALRLGVSDLIEWDIRYVPDEDVSQIYARADLVVLPYKKIYQSGVLLLAMSYGKPVLVSDIDGMTEIVNDGVNGYVFRSEDAVSLGRKLIALSEPDANVSSVGKMGLDYVRKHHDWAAGARALLECYSD